eukprot:GDKI01011251.1.p3 GENE.GDKI01011251.1~~GDKI01011251.1.p3  ORF type:complete len:128 (-),score=14.10 GDKI01011251.1:16-399(-)
MHPPITRTCSGSTKPDQQPCSSTLCDKLVRASQPTHTHHQSAHTAVYLVAPIGHATQRHSCVAGAVGSPSAGVSSGLLGRSVSRTTGTKPAINEAHVEPSRGAGGDHDGVGRCIELIEKSMREHGLM